MCRKISFTFSCFPEFVGKFAILFLFFQNVCYNIEIFGTHLNSFWEMSLHFMASQVPKQGALSLYFSFFSFFWNMFVTSFMQDDAPHSKIWNSTNVKIVCFPLYNVL